MNILLIGQVALHWGRLEFGNMGNYYIIEPFIREIHRVFPDAVVRTVFQMSEEFCQREKIEVLPMELYYGYRDNELELAKDELEEAKKIAGEICREPKSFYIKEILWADLVLDFSGDMWGDNADIAGKDRFEVGLIKDYIVQILNKPIFMIAGSPGPFDMVEKNLDFAKEVFKNFQVVTNREEVSIEVLKKSGFSVDNVKNYACPSFLFEPKNDKALYNKIRNQFADCNKPIIGFILCGWNFAKTPFSKWPRENEEYSNFVQLLEGLCQNTDANICLISHSNGFPIPPAKFELQHGRDYWVVQQLYELVKTKEYKDRITLVEDVCTVWQTKGIIGNFDMLISGRVHGAVAGISQCVPTMIIDYGQEPKAHKLLGFAKMTGLEEYIASPGNDSDMLNKAMNCWENREIIKESLEEKIPKVQELARKNLEVIKEHMSKKVKE